MPFTFRLRITALLAATTLVGGCSLLSSDEDETRVLDVWMMNQSAGEEFVNRVVADFETQYEGVEVRVAFQDWVGIGEKVTEALTSGEGPDIIEVGNTQVAQYVETDGVKDLTNYVVSLDGDNWIPGLADPGEVYGHQYGIPFYAANRVVIYRTDLFEEAGITEPPADHAEWLAATEALNEVPGQQGIYLAGQNWYVLAGFIWDEGGELAVESGGQWRGTLDTPQAAAGMEFYAELQALGEGPKDSDEANPPHEEAFAAGNVAQIISVPGSAQTILDHNPELAGKLGFFPVPGKEAGTPGSVFTGGSNLIINESSQDTRLAHEFIKLMTGDRWQTELAQTRNLVPNRTTLAEVVQDDPATAAMVEGARSGRATPQSPNWGVVETNNPIKAYQTAVLTGADPLLAGQQASETITAMLGGFYEEDGAGEDGDG